MTDKCVICGRIKEGKEHKQIISCKEYRFFVCNDCENEQEREYMAFFDNIRENLKDTSEKI